MSEKLTLLFKGIGIVLFWRGIWLAADLYIFPENLPLSMTVCTLVGMTIIILMKYKNF
jgi:hypothetical protein